MPALNQGKIIKALEKCVAGPQGDFIWSFLKAYGTSAATISRLRLGDRQRNVGLFPSDVAIPQKIYFRAVDRGETLDGAMEAIRSGPAFAKNKIRFALVTDYETALAYDRKVDDATAFPFAEFPTYYEFFLPLTGSYEKPMAYAENPADVKACERMGRLYDAVRAANRYEGDGLHALNVFLTRLLFCFFAEDTGIFPEDNLMTKALQANTQADGSDVRAFFERLFTVLDLPEGSQARKKLPASFQKFPYVDGGLFRDRPQVPDFDAKTRRLLVECGSMKWGEISPVIFGSMFQAVIDPEKRRSLGAHYTSEKNILKVARPLFLDGLEEEFERIKGLAKGKAKALREFQKKLGSLGFLDPACGCGNFLIVAFRELRRLELKALAELREIEPGGGQWMDVDMLSQVSIGQFYGIEIEEFPVEVAHVSMWLMEHVMNVELGRTFGQAFPTIPLKHSTGIVCGNALTMDWEKVAPAKKLNYIMGNPPFGGSTFMTKEQKAQHRAIFGNTKGAGMLDFVTAWYEQASLYMLKNKEIDAAFVSTNSICQGEQVAPLWGNMLARGITIHFAHQTFRWSNEAKNNAGVYCVIVGFTYRQNIHTRRLFIYPDINAQPNETICSVINSYLLPSANIIVKSMPKVLSAPNQMIYGNKPTDGGNLIIEYGELENFLEKEPQAKPYVKKLIGSEEFLHSKLRYCLWLKDAPEDILSLPLVRKRIEGCRQMRLASPDQGARKLAARPEMFRDTNNPSAALVVPRVSSEKRRYIPMGFIDQKTIVSDLVNIVPYATYYDFAILTSAMHMAWVRTVCGRLKSDYRYSRDLCYNTFPWPAVTEAQQKAVYKLGMVVLLAREHRPDLTLAELYDPEKMPDELREAHKNLDLAVDKLYRKKPFANDEDRLRHLFKLYAGLLKGQSVAEQGLFDEEN